MGVPPPLTVTGRPLAKRYDTVLAHEHLLIDIRCWLDEDHAPSRHLRDERVGEETVAAVRRNPFACADNLVLDDRTLMAGELGRLTGHGSTLVVDVTPVGVGRDRAAIVDVARRAGVDVVCGCGRYIADARPGDEELRVEDYRDEVLAEFAGPVPRPAVIGEIGTSDPIEPMERRALTGAAQAQALLGVALYVHLHPWGKRGHEALNIVAGAGGQLDRVVLCHLDPAIPDGLDYHRSLMNRGATIAFDIWGDEDAYGAVRMPTDQERLAAVLELVAGGYGDRLVHSHDVCTKTQLAAFGGAGFDHLPRVIAPQMAAVGLPAEEIHRQLSGTALALLHPKRRTP